jgi:hypothetical protein
VSKLPSVLLVRRSLSNLAALTAAPEVFSNLLSPWSLFHGSPSHEIRPPSEFAARLCRRSGLERLPLLGFPSPVAPSAWEVYIPTEFCLLRSVPPSGFLNLLTAYSSQCLVALFHATGTRWVLPSELCSLPGAVPPLDGPCPRVVPRPAPRFLKNAISGRSRLQGLALLESPALAACCLG